MSRECTRLLIHNSIPQPPLWSEDWLWENGRLSLIQQCLQSNSRASAHEQSSLWDESTNYPGTGLILEAA